MSRCRISPRILLIPGTLVGLYAAALLGRAARAVPQSSSTGQISGKVFFKGSKPKLAALNMDRDPVCASEHSEPVYAEDGEVNSDGTLPNVFVYVKSGAEKYTARPPSQPVVLDQRGCIYVPHVLGIMVGQELKVLSSDPTTHNVHAVCKVNREWNRTQTPGAGPLVSKFTRPEFMIPVECNVHPWMKAYVGVVSNPFYAVTAKDGRFVITGLPPGEYTLSAWTATFGTQQQRVTVPASGSTVADFTFTQAQ
jgi:hypothetical protein